MWRQRRKPRLVSPFALRKPSGKRTGATIVETAIVMPVFFLFVFAIIEFGHAIMINNVMKNACRQAARWGSATGATTEEVEQYVRDKVIGAVDPALLTVQIKDASQFDTGGDAPDSIADFAAMPDIELANAEPRQLFMVRAAMRYGDVALIPQPWLSNALLTGQTFTRHE